MFYDQDIDGFYLDFAVTASVNGLYLKAIFDNPYHGSAIYSEIVGGSNPTATVKSFFLKAYNITENDTFEINETSYRIITIKNDGTGFAVLELQEL